MALVVKDRVRETSTTQGTGTFTLAGAVTGYQSFSAIGNGNTTYYTIYLQASNEWEVGIGTYTASGTTLSRDTILASSNGGAVVNFSAGTKDVFVTYPAGRSVYYDTATNVTVNQLSATTVDATNIEVTNIKAKDGTAALSIADSTGAVTVATALTANGGAVFNENGADVDFRVEGDTDANLIFADASTDRVGIGVNPPAAKFHVESAGPIQSLLRTTGSTSYTSLRLYNDQGSSTRSLEINYSGSAYSGVLLTSGPSGEQATIATSGAYPLTLGTSNTGRISITSGGQVNIGGNFTSTNNTLQVTGNAAIGYTTAAPTTGLIVAGNVGIGTDAPGAKLELSTAATDFTGLILNNTSTNGKRYNLVSAGSAAYFDAPAGSFAIRDITDSVTRLIINSSGNLGLGVTPSAWVSGYSAMQIGPGATVNSTSDGRASISSNIFVGSGPAAKYIANGFGSAYTQLNGAHLWLTAPNNTSGANVNASGISTVMTLDASGNLGVGQTSPTTRLEAHSQAAGTQNIATIRSTNVILKIGTTDIGNGEVTYNIFPASNSSTAGAHIWQGGGTERARITSGGTFQTSLDAEIYGVTVGRGAGAVSTNTAVGASALAANTTGNQNVAVGYQAGYSNTVGSDNTAVGMNSLRTNTTGANNTAIGQSALYANTGSQNTAVGKDALIFNTTGATNTAVGIQAAYTNTIGTSLTAIGAYALYGNTTGVRNTAVGENALTTNSIGIDNAALGRGALALNTSGSYNSAFGKDALYSNTTGSYNTAVGYQAGYSNTFASDVCFIGYAAGYSNTTGTLNTAIGSSSPLYANTFGGNNTALGSASLQENTTGSNNTAGGALALGKNTTGANNTAIGYQAAYLNQTGTRLVAIGQQALYNNTTGYNVAIGARALYSNTTGVSNIAIGTFWDNVVSSPLYSNTTGVSNIAVGNGALTGNTFGSQNTGIGVYALNANSTGSNNTAVGYQAGYSNTFGEITAIGYRAGYSATTGIGNTFVGVATGFSTTTGNNNTVVGSNISGSLNTAFYANTTGGENAGLGNSVLSANTTGNYNSALGARALALNTTGSNNSAVGQAALYSNTTGSSNTAVGFQALYGSATSVGSVAVGYHAGYSAPGDYSVFVGYRAGYFASTVGNTSNTGIGAFAGYSLTTGTFNTLVGGNAASGGAGYFITYGSKNTILGNYTGNQGGLDIRTANNYIVLSDGDGNPRQIIDNSGRLIVGGTTAYGSAATFTAAQASVVINQTSSVTYAGLRIYNDQGSAFRALEIDYSGSAYSGALITNGPTGESAAIATTGAYPLALGTNNTARAVITSAGDVGIGTVSPDGRLQVTYANATTTQGNDGAGVVWLTNTNTTNNNWAQIFFTDSDGGAAAAAFGVQYTDHANDYGEFSFATRGAGGFAERARITSGGYFKAADNGASGYTAAGTYHQFVSTATASQVLIVDSTDASYTSDVLFLGGNRNTTNGSWNFFRCFNRASSAEKLIITDSGTVTNATGTYGTISDAKMKTDIVDAGSQWSDIKAIRFRKFKMKDDPSGLVQLGVVAQEVELTSPGLVDEHTDRDAEGNDLGTTTKSVKTSVLLMKAAVALQEAMARIEKLEAEVAALKGV